MRDFETICQARGERFAASILELWESITETKHPFDVTLKERWVYFADQPHDFHSL